MFQRQHLFFLLTALIATDLASGQSCLSDDDCAGRDTFCSSGICNDFGSCNSLVDCLNPSNNYPVNLCVGYLFCDDESNTCGIDCTASFCPPDTEQVACEVSPCSIAVCDEPFTSCVDYDCGSCTAVFLNATGHQVCQNSNSTLPPEVPCSLDQDCEENQYCSSGQCREFGSCGSTFDCFNPSNVYPSPACVGFLYCDEGGTCSRECSASFCPPEVEDVTCDESPCATTICGEDYVSCTDYSCGNCTALFFTSSGSQVCGEPLDATDSLQLEMCLSSEDCDDDSFCSGFRCLQKGSCVSRVDCINPSNLYAVIECVGPLDCDAEGRCGRECTGFFCPDEDDVGCSGVDPCATEECNEEYEHCIISNCGSCSAIFLDAAGNQVCAGSLEPEPVMTSCNSTSDCRDDEYCSIGACRTIGTCATRTDCLNPLNTYPVIECVGPLNCEEGLCGRVCTGFFCPEGNDVQCLAAPCSVTECDEGYESCIDEYCGGCNAIFFNSTGHPVCNNSSNTVPDQHDAGCQSSSDCDDTSFCSSNQCISKGSCSSRLDCLNPSNLYGVIECVGPLSCDGEGKCGRECTGFFCPDEDDVDCSGVDPCSTEECNEEYQHCITSNCGSCSAIFIDAAGNQVCTPASDVDGLEAASCSSDTDCKSDQYCSIGECRAFGSCSIVLDCENPANIYADKKCAGYLFCNTTTMVCDRECSGTCENGDLPVNCAAQPCTVTDCSESYVSCVDDYCGGCNAKFFDAMGKQVCAEKAVTADAGTGMEAETADQDKGMEGDAVSNQANSADTWTSFSLLIATITSSFLLQWL